MSDVLPYKINLRLRVNIKVFHLYSRIQFNKRNYTVLIFVLIHFLFTYDAALVG